VQSTTRLAYDISICVARRIADHETSLGGCKTMAADQPIGCRAKQLGYSVQPMIIADRHWAAHTR
jgi:hypothetical protein